MSKAKRAVVFGASGFVGTKLIPYLNEKGIPNLPFSSSELNLIDEASINKLNEVIKDGDYLIFLSCLTPRKGRDSNTFMKNVAMANNVANFLDGTDKKISGLQYISSDAVFDNLPRITEETQPESLDLYSAMHISREVIMQDVCKRNKIPYTILRPSPIYGANSPHNSYGPVRFITQAKENQEIKLFGGGEENRDHIFVEDFVEIIYRTMNDEIVGTFNIAFGESISFFDVANLVAEKVGGVKVIVTERQNELTHKHFDNSKILKTFSGFQFTSLEDGLGKIL
jgi:UDP-glucose 4-epimerase